MERRELGFITALKGIAIMAVTMVHTGASGLPGIWGMIGSQGARGVQMFFVISGMLTFASLTRAFPERRFSLRMLMRWYLNKYIRIAPMYYLALLVSMLTHSWSTYWLGTEEHVSILNIFTHIFLIHGLFPHYTNSILGVEWYLGCLWLYYLVSPFIFLLVDCFEKSIVFAIALYIVRPWMSSGLARLLPVESDPEIYNTYITAFGPLSHLLIFSMGIVLFFLVRWLDKRTVRCRIVFSYSLLLFAMILIYGQIIGTAPLYRFSRLEMFALFFGIIIASQTIYSSVLINNKFFRTFGNYSYGIYLFQFIWMNFYDQYINYVGAFDWTIKYIISVFALLLISFLCDKIYDKPVWGKLKKAISNKELSERILE